MTLISLHDKYRSILLDLIFRELKKDIDVAFMDATIDLKKKKKKKKNTMCKSIISIFEVPFYILCHHYNYIKLYPSVDSHIFRRL